MKNKAVILGGGSGLSSILAGLKEFPIDITAVVSMADDGASTGKLRRAFNVPAVGDIRRVLVSLATSGSTLERLFNYRFHANGGGDIHGHTVGNLILTALFDLNGSLKGAIDELSKVFSLKGRVLPLTEDLVTLVGDMADGSSVVGEENLRKIGRRIVGVRYKDPPKVDRDVPRAIEEADLIVLAPGSLWTSIIPNLICPEVRSAIMGSSADLLYICNAMTEHGETDGYRVSDHLRELDRYLPGRIGSAIVNRAPVPAAAARKYLELERAEPVLLDEAAVESLGIRVISDDLISVQDGVVRHDALKTAFLVFAYLMRERPSGR